MEVRGLLAIFRAPVQKIGKFEHKLQFQSGEHIISFIGPNETEQVPCLTRFGAYHRPSSQCEVCLTPSPNIPCRIGPETGLWHCAEGGC